MKTLMLLLTLAAGLNAQTAAKKAHVEGETKTTVNWMGIPNSPLVWHNGKWVVDEAAVNREEKRAAEFSEYQHKRSALIAAARSRVLTCDEFALLMRDGPEVLLSYTYSPGGTSWSDGYKQDELEKRFDELLLQQYRIRSIAKAPDCETK